MTAPTSSSRTVRWALSDDAHERPSPHELRRAQPGQLTRRQLTKTIAVRVVQTLEELIVDPAFEHRQITVGSEPMRKPSDPSPNNRKAAGSQLSRGVCGRSVRSQLALGRGLHPQLPECALEGRVGREIERPGLPCDCRVSAARSEQPKRLSGGGRAVGHDVQDE